jgi:hypothetical protein
LRQPPSPLSIGDKLLFKTPKPPKAVKTGKSQSVVVAEELEAEDEYREIL